MADLVGLTSGTIFASDYRVLHPIAGGGMGAVYAVEQLSTGQKRALKLMHPHLVEDAARRGRFEREARVGARIASDHVVQVIAAGVDAATGMPWMAMELLEGESLGAYAERRGPLSRDEVAEILRQLGHALGAAHAAGVVHRDLKPDNVFVAAARRSGADILVKVLDFGIAKVVAEANPSATQPMGTLSWMAPEQTETSAAITPAADVWSIGLLAFWMLTGKPYWRCANDAQGPSAPRLVRELLIEPLDGASTRAGALGTADRIPPGFDGWFERCVIREPGARMQDGGEACAALLRILGEPDGRTPPRLSPLEISATGTAPLALDRVRVTPPRSSFDETTEAIDLPSLPTAPAAPSAPALAPPAVKRRGALWIALGALGLITALAMGRWVTASAPSPTPAPSAPDPPAPRPIAITDLPPPRSSSPQAVALYMAALQSLHDANWGQAEASLEEAVRLDPSFAAAHLRLAMTVPRGDPVALHARYALAVRGRATLDERDQALLQALEPVYAWTPPDLAACEDRLRAAAERFPLDAELRLHLGTVCSSQDTLDDDVDAVFQAVELDPQSADAWSALAIHLSTLERFDEAAQATDRCLALSPSSSDCLTQRAGIHERRGRCAEMEADIRRALSTGAKPTPWNYEVWVSALYALDRPTEIILEAQRQKWPLVSEARRRGIEIVDRADLEVAEGRFDLAEARLLAGLPEIEANPGEDLHNRFASRLIYLYKETGQLDRAARVAADYLKRKDAWQSLPEMDSTLVMLYVMARGGLLSHKELVEKRARYVAEAKAHDPKMPAWDEWSMSHWSEGSREEVDAAIAAIRDDMGPPPSYLAWKVGELYERAGQHARAIPLLRDALKPCARPIWEVPLHLAKALEGTGDRAAACAIYEKILAHWGNAKPRSVTADEARARVRAACPASAPPR
ncbi:MAG: protein kinase [Byssovorax sp.]